MKTINLVFERVLLYGGTFDPPHLGHRQVLASAMDAFPDAQVEVLVGYQPAGAFGQHKQPAASFLDRIEMCRLAFAGDIASHRVHINPIEATLPQPNYTSVTLKILAEKNPGAVFILLMGSDQLQNFTGWKAADWIVKHFDIAVLARPDTASWQSILTTLSAKLGVLVPEGQHWLWQAHGTRIYLLKGLESAAASRVIRSSLSDGQSQCWLSESVARYITEHKLYVENED